MDTLTHVSMSAPAIRQLAPQTGSTQQPQPRAKQDPGVKRICFSGFSRDFTPLLHTPVKAPEMSATHRRDQAENLEAYLSREAKRVTAITQR